MSHWTTIKVEVRDIAALQAACNEMGLQFVDGVTPQYARGYAGNLRKCDHLIKLRGPYDVAVDGSEASGYTLSTDWWDGHVAKEVGVEFSRLLQNYGVAKTERMARARGLRVTKKVQADGSIRMTLTGASL